MSETPINALSLPFAARFLLLNIHGCSEGTASFGILLKLLRCHQVQTAPRIGYEYLKSRKNPEYAKYKNKSMGDADAWRAALHEINASAPSGASVVVKTAFGRWRRRSGV